MRWWACMHVNICACVCMFVCNYICVCMCLDVYVYVCVHELAYLCKWATPRCGHNGCHDGIIKKIKPHQDETRCTSMVAVQLDTSSPGDFS